MSSLLIGQLHDRVDTNYITLALIRRAISIAARAIAALRARFGFVDIQCPPIQLLASQTGNGGHCLVLFRHLDERKASRLSGLLVGNNVDGRDFTKTLEGLA